MTDLAALDEEATPGPWRIDEWGNLVAPDDADGDPFVLIRHPRAAGPSQSTILTATQLKRFFAFIAAMRNSLPALIARVREAEELREQIAKAAMWCEGDGDTLVEAVAEWANMGDAKDARIRELEEGLRPFAEAPQDATQRQRAPSPPFEYIDYPAGMSDSHAYPAGPLTYGMIRRARSLLSPPQREEGGSPAEKGGD